MKKKVYESPTCRVVGLFFETHFCVISKWNDGHGGSDDVIDNPDNPLPPAGGKGWDFDVDSDNRNFNNSFSVWSSHFKYQ
ncbi:MAG: hypothetical protein IJ698_02235 [Prevotella sp.]|nr:hypothetical protein [Prevotella sp.]